MNTTAISLRMGLLDGETTGAAINLYFPSLVICVHCARVKHCAAVSFILIYFEFDCKPILTHIHIRMHRGHQWLHESLQRTVGISVSVLCCYFILAFTQSAKELSIVERVDHFFFLLSSRSSLVMCNQMEIN